jgi:hypothetical protein
MRRVSLLLFVGLTLGIGCQGKESASNGRPCVVSEEDMASVWNGGDIAAIPQDNGVNCVYAADGEPVVGVAIRSPEAFEEERARFEDQGILLPPLEPTDGFDQEATVDPRYNSLNVTAEDLVVSVEILGRDPADAGEQLDLEKQIARMAVNELSSS